MDSAQSVPTKTSERLNAAAVQHNARARMVPGPPSTGVAIAVLGKCIAAPSAVLGKCKKIQSSALHAPRSPSDPDRPPIAIRRRPAPVGARRTAMCGEDHFYIYNRSRTCISRTVLRARRSFRFLPTERRLMAERTLVRQPTDAYSLLLLLTGSTSSSPSSLPFRPNESRPRPCWRAPGSHTFAIRSSASSRS